MNIYKGDKIELNNEYEFVVDSCINLNQEYNMELLVNCIRDKRVIGRFIIHSKFVKMVVEENKRIVEV